MTTTTHITTIVGLHCSECGVLFGLSSSYMANRREDHRGFRCPNGHNQYFPQETDEEKLRRQLERANTRVDYWQKEQDRTERRRRAAVGQVTKIKRRVGKGVCPCCNRTFPNLGAHMGTEHPEYAEASS